MRELKLSSPLNIQIITEPERMALRIALDKSIGENLGMVLALKDTKREIPQGLDAVCTANAIKYLWRWKGKNGVEDLKKARWYIDRLIKHYEKEGAGYA